MGKSITLPIDYNPSDNMVGKLTQDTSILWTASNGSLLQLKTVLEASTNTLVGLSTSGSINPWAAFRHPTGGAPYSLGDFIGYNHNAKPPVYFSTPPPSNVTMSIFGSVNIPFSLARGERDSNLILLDGSLYKANKNYVDASYGLSVFAVPVRDGSIGLTITVSPTTSQYFRIEPQYVASTDTAKHIGTIEDGYKQTYVTVSNPYTGEVVPYPSHLADSTSTSPYIKRIYCYIRNTSASSVSVYARMTGTITGGTASTIDFGLLSFTAYEEKYLNGYMTFTKSGSFNITAYVALQIGNSGYANTNTLNTNDFNWTV